jgi:hypothetical protein
VTSNFKNLANLNCHFQATKKLILQLYHTFPEPLNMGRAPKHKTTNSTTNSTGAGSVPPVAVGNTIDSGDQQATIANTVVTAGNVITDVVDGGDPAVDGAKNTDNARTTVDAAVNIVNTANNERSTAGDEDKTCADTIDDTSKASAAAITVPNTTGNADIDFANTAHTAAAGNAFVATAAAVGNAILAENAVHAIINPGKTPTANDTGLLCSIGNSKSAGGEGAVDALVQVSVHICTFFLNINSLLI